MAETKSPNPWAAIIRKPHTWQNHNCLACNVMFDFSEKDILVVYTVFNDVRHWYAVICPACSKPIQIWDISDELSEILPLDEKNYRLKLGENGELLELSSITEIHVKESLCCFRLRRYKYWEVQPNHIIRAYQIQQFPYGFKRRVEALNVPSKELATYPIAKQ